MITKLFNEDTPKEQDVNPEKESERKKEEAARQAEINRQRKLTLKYERRRFFTCKNCKYFDEKKLECPKYRDQSNGLLKFTGELFPTANGEIYLKAKLKTQHDSALPHKVSVLDCEQFEFSNRPQISILCYANKLSLFKKKCPGARFEIIVRAIPKWFKGQAKGNHLLSPSWELFKDGKNGLDWKDYKARFLEQMDNVEPMNYLRKLKRVAAKQTLFLVCFEADYNKCHRSLVKEIMEGLD